MNNELLNPTVIEAVQKAAQSVGIPTLAAEMDMRPSSLYNCLNPWADRNTVKLGLEAALYVMRRSGDVEALRLMALELGYTLEPIEMTVPDGESLEEECLQDFDCLSAFSKAVRDGNSTISEVDRLGDAAKQEIDQTVVFFATHRM